MAAKKTIAKPFYFKQFAIAQDKCLMKVGTDGVLLGAWADIDKAANILDIGTGTGLIAIMLAQRNAIAKIDAVEIDVMACEQAKSNIENSPWAARLNVLPIAIQEFVGNTSTTYDLIVSNPPFFSGGTLSSNQDKTNVRHTVKLPHSDLLSGVRSLLRPNGKFATILPLIEGLRFIELAKTYGLYCTHKTEVLPKREKKVERLLLQFEQQEGRLQTDQIVIQQEGRNNWTDEYIQLTQAFYLNM